YERVNDRLHLGDSTSHRAPRRGSQQFLDLLLPKLGHAGGAVAAGVFAARYQIHAAILDALEFALEDSKLGWIAFVVGGIDGQQRGLHALQAGRRVVVARRVPLIQEVVGIGFERRRQPLVEQLVR